MQITAIAEQGTVVRVAPHRALAVAASAVIVFMAPIEPNLALRYGPFVAAFGFLLSGPLRFRLGWTEWSLVLFVTWVVLGRLWTVFPEAYPTNMLGVISVAVSFVGLRAVIRDGVGVRTLIAAYAAGALVGLVRTSSEFAAPEALRDSLSRVTQVGDLNVNYVAYSAVAAVLLLTLLLSGGGVDTRRWRLITALAIAALAVGIIGSQTRGALLAIVFLGLWMLLSRAVRPIRALAVGAVSVVIAVCSGWADGALNILNFGERAVFGLSGRSELWAHARSIWEQHVVEGAGFGAVRAVTNYHLPAHNTVLEMGATLGAVGLALFLMTVGNALRDRLTTLSPRQRSVRIGALIATLLPVMLSSTWELSAAAWVALALLSQPVRSRTDRPVPASMVRPMPAARPLSPFR